MTVDREMQAFQADLMEAVRDMKAGRAARVTQVALSPAADARAKTGLSQTRFAELLGVSARTLQNWEQGRRKPVGPAQALLKVVQLQPDAVLKALSV